MTTIVKRLACDLSAEIRTAEEIYVAVALMNSNGLRFILDNLQKTCRQNYLVGIDLPTEPKALEILNELQLKSDINVKIYTDKEYFHPKLYLIKQKDSYSAFIGSANCTNGGLFENVELTIFTRDQKVCSELLEWFKQYFQLGKPLKTTFIEQYRLEYLERQDRKKQEEKLAKKEKSSLNEEFEATLSEKNEFIKTLKQYRKSNEYNDIVKDREQTIENLRKALDYPAYQNINIDDYFKEWELGHLIAIAKPAIKRNIAKLRKMLQYLCDEGIDVAVRYNRVLNGDMKVEGVSKAFISKVLVAHRPDLYFVKNNKSEKALRKYGIIFPRRLTDGEKYKITCKFLRQICEDTNIIDLAVLDYYLYLEGNNDE